MKEKCNSIFKSEFVAKEVTILKKKKDLKLPADFRPPCFFPLSGYPAVVTYAVAKRAFTLMFAVETKRNRCRNFREKRWSEGQRGVGGGVQEARKEQREIE